jgi:hypothetical protein
MYYIQCPVLEEPLLRGGDALVKIIDERQRC